MIYKELIKRDYEIIPVNPKIDEIVGVKVFSSIKGIDPVVEGVFIITNPETAELLVQECVEVKIDKIWLHKGVGKGSVNEKYLLYVRRMELRWYLDTVLLCYYPVVTSSIIFTGFTRN